MPDRKAPWRLAQELAAAIRKMEEQRTQARWASDLDNSDRVEREHELHNAVLAIGTGDMKKMQAALDVLNRRGQVFYSVHVGRGKRLNGGSHA